MDTTKLIKPCAGYEETLVLSMYGELGPEEEKALGAHLSGCPACRAYREGLGRTLVPVDAPGPSAVETRRAVRGVMERIATQKSGAAGRPSYSRYLAPAFASLAVVVVAVWFGLYQAPTHTGAPGGGRAVVRNTTGVAGVQAASAQGDVEVVQNLDILADLDLMADLDTVDRIERL